MPKSAILWTRGNWYIERRYYSGKPFYGIVNARTGFCDVPVLYPDKTVAYDWPERIPAYVKAAYRKLRGAR